MSKRRFTEDSWRKEPWFKAVVAALRACKTEDDVANLLRDIATLSELQALGERLEVARLLSNGLSYRQIAQQTGASTTTVTRVAAFLENGQGGYRNVFKAHRHHDFRKKLHSDENSKEPHIEAKKENTKIAKSPLQKHLQKF